MNVSIIGCGYVGLVSGAGLAEKGHAVVCVDSDAGKVAGINARMAPFFEEGLPELLGRHVPGRLRATGDLREAVAASDLTLIAVGTPFDGRRIDLSFVEAACAQLGEALRKKPSYHVVVVKSTVVPGTTGGLVRATLESASGKKAGTGFGLGMNPEFLTEGQAVSDFLFPDRIVLGAIDERSLGVMERLYEGFAGAPVIRTNPGTAELIKYASNALLATMISFSNEFAALASALGGVDIVDVMRGVHVSRYLSVPDGTGRTAEAPINRFLEAGCGSGGSCLPKDVNALIAVGEQSVAPMRLLEAVMQINEGQPRKTVDILRKHFPSLTGRRAAVLGLAFKPDTSDIRESPAIPIIRELLDAGVTVKAYDPVAMPAVREVFRNHAIELSESLSRAIEGVDAVVVVTRWKQFDELPELLARLNPQALVLDGRRMFDKRAVARYAGIGM